MLDSHCKTCEKCLIKMLSSGVDKNVQYWRTILQKLGK